MSWRGAWQSVTVKLVHVLAKSHQRQLVDRSVAAYSSPPLTLFLRQPSTKNPLTGGAWMHIYLVRNVSDDVAYTPDLPALSYPPRERWVADDVAYTGPACALIPTSHEVGC